MATRVLQTVPLGAGSDDGYAVPESLKGAGWLARLFHLFAHAKLVNFLMLSAIVIGFFQGWMKYKLRMQWLTFAFDIPVTLAWIICVWTIPRGKAVFPNCGMSKVLIATSLTCLVYAALPFGVPWLISAAAFRAWCFIPLMFLVGYHTTRSVKQMEVYLWLLIFLGVLAAIYALTQSPEEVRAMMKDNPEMTFRLQNQFYADSQGRGVLRRFSTFVSSAAFGGMMAYCITFAVSRLIHPGCSVLERIVLAGSCMLMTYGVLLSGARSSLGTLVLGLLFAIWYRRNSRLAIVVAILGGVSVSASILFLGSSVTERFLTLLDSKVLFQRLYIVVVPALEHLAQHPLGDGLGRSGHGLPVILSTRFEDFQLRPIDGDLGCVAVDMGAVGLALMGAMIFVGIKDAWAWMRNLQGSPLGVIALPAGSMFILSASQLSYGSPFLGIPGGVLLWFFLGSMRRLVEDYEKLASVQGREVADVSDQFVSFITTPRLSRLYRKRRETSAKERLAPMLMRSGSRTSPRPEQRPRQDRIHSVTSEASKTRPSSKVETYREASAPQGDKRFLFRRSVPLKRKADPR